jgi:hypothetical protein
MCTTLPRGFIDFITHDDGTNLDLLIVHLSLTVPIDRSDLILVNDNRSHNIELSGRT